MMLRFSKKTIDYFHDVLQRNVTAANPPSPPERTYDVSRGQNRYVRLPLKQCSRTLLTQTWRELLHQLFVLFLKALPKEQVTRCHKISGFF